jgi:ABC-type antimicrobial peptide transport system permease subunit
MSRQEIPPVDMFHLPPWAGLAAVFFGIGVSIVAGLYPSARAARIDPVEALRHE